MSTVSGTHANSRMSQGSTVVTWIKELRDKGGGIKQNMTLEMDLPRDHPNV
jgi:hypothetical protein